MEGIFIGVPIGIVCSLLAWWLLFHGIVPKLRFSNRISKIESKENAGRFRYRVKFENHGRRRIVNLEISVCLNIRGLSDNSPETWDVVNFKLKSPTNHPFIDPVNKKGIRRFVILDINNTPDFSQKIYPQSIRNKHQVNQLSLEDLFQLGNETSVRVSILGEDAYSGSRKLFQSKKYKIDDIKNSPFKLYSLKIQEIPPPLILGPPG